MVRSVQRVLQHRSIPSAPLHQLMQSLSDLGCGCHISVLLRSLDRLLVIANGALANTALRACCRAGNAAAASEVYRSFWDRGISPDAASFDAVLLVTAGQDAYASVHVMRLLLPVFFKPFCAPDVMASAKTHCFLPEPCCACCDELARLGTERARGPQPKFLVGGIGSPSHPPKHIYIYIYIYIYMLIL